MNKILTGALLLLFSSSAAAQTPRDSIAFATAQWRTADLGGGAECRYAQIDMFGSRQSISVATYPGRRFTTSIVHLDRRAESTSDLGKAAGAEIAVNGSYFNVKTFEPVTFVLLDRKIVGRTTPEEAFRTNGVIAFKDRKGRRMEIFPCDTTQYADVARRYRSALAAGPVLIDGEAGRATMELIMAVYKSAAEGRTVDLPLAKDDPFYTREGAQARMPHFYKKTGFLAKFAKDEIVLASSNMK